VDPLVDLIGTRPSSSYNLDGGPSLFLTWTSTNPLPDLIAGVWSKLKVFFWGVTRGDIYNSEFFYDERDCDCG
jgi:hypothetical protein